MVSAAVKGKRWGWLVLAAGLCALTMQALACSADSAPQLLDTAQLEERQNNPEHALQLYHEIVSKFPQSKAADTARARIAALEGQGTR